MTASRPPLLVVVQPSADYAGRVRQAGFEAVLVATPDRAVDLEDQDHAQVIAVDLQDPEAVLASLRGYAARQGIVYGGIVTFVCEFLLLAARLARGLDLPFHSEEAVRTSRGKELTAAAWKKAGVPLPASREVARLEDLLAFSEAHAGPWILKPVDRSGSEWVLRVARVDDLREADARLTRGLTEPGDPPDHRVPYLAQVQVRGREFGADVFLENNILRILRLTEKYLLDEPGLAGLVGAYYPARLMTHERTRLESVFLQAALALGMKRGIAMVDVILTEEGPYLLEIALRPGGDCLPDLCRRAFGYDPVAAACRVALGHRPEPSGASEPKPLAALHLMSSRSGVVRRLGFERLLAHPAVVELLEVYHGPGELLRCWPGSYDERIIASCLVHCAEPRDLPGLCRNLPELIDLELEPEPLPQPESHPR